MPPIRLEGLRPQVYEHPSDSAALNALTHTAGFDKVVEKLNAWGIERILRVRLTGSYIRVQPDNFPAIYRILAIVRDRLDVPIHVDLYIAAGGEINAYTVGVERPLIVLTTALVDLLSEDEIMFVIAHELGHVKSRHVLYYQIAEFLPVIADVLGSVTFGMGDLFSLTIEVALLYWKRMSEFTADRAGLLGCQNADAAWRTMIKLAGLPSKYYGSINTEDFLRQAKDFKDMDTDALSKIAKALSTLGATHPWTVLRAQQLHIWIESGGYQFVLDNPRGAPPPIPQLGRFCPQCGYTLSGRETFCPACGFSPRGGGPPPLPPVRR